MPRKSKAQNLLSDAALHSLTALGQRLKEARLKRNWTQALAAQKAGLSESSIKKVEAGATTISVSAYLSVLDIYGQSRGLDAVLPAGSDTIGDALARSQLRSRAGTKRSSSQTDEWDL